MAIVRAIVAGERDPVRLAEHRDARCGKSVQEIAQYLTGTWRQEHLFKQVLGCVLRGERVDGESLVEPRVQRPVAPEGEPVVELGEKILGLNAARVHGVDPTVVRRKVTADDLSQLRLAYKYDRRSVPMSDHRFHGPRTWREYLGFRRWTGE